MGYAGVQIKDIENGSSDFFFRFKETQTLL